MGHSFGLLSAVGLAVLVRSSFCAGPIETRNRAAATSRHVVAKLSNEVIDLGGGARVDLDAGAGVGLKARTPASEAVAATAGQYCDKVFAGVCLAEFSTASADTEFDSSGASAANNITFRLAIPDVATTPFDALVQVIAPTSVAWAGLAWGGAMTENPLTVAWPLDKSSGAVVSSRWASTHSLPAAYAGASYTALSSSSNATHWTLNVLCSGCSQWNVSGGALSTLDPAGPNGLAWASSGSPVEQPASNTSLFSFHDAVGLVTVDFRMGRVAQDVFQRYIAHLSTGSGNSTGNSSSTWSSPSPSASAASNSSSSSTRPSSTAVPSPKSSSKAISAPAPAPHTIASGSSSTPTVRTLPSRTTALPPVATTPPPPSGSDDGDDEGDDDEGDDGSGDDDGSDDGQAPPPFRPPGRGGPPWARPTGKRRPPFGRPFGGRLNVGGL